MIISHDLPTKLSITDWKLAMLMSSSVEEPREFVSMFSAKECWCAPIYRRAAHTSMVKTLFFSAPTTSGAGDPASASCSAEEAEGRSDRASSREGFGKAGKQQEVIWGPEYSPATAKFVVGSRESKSHPSKYRHDEVFDFLRGERVGEPVYPCRLRQAGASKQRLKEFRKSVRRSFALTENEGELVLMHEVLPGHRAGDGFRSPSHGLKIVPTKAMAKILVCKVGDGRDLVAIRCLR